MTKIISKKAIIVIFLCLLVSCNKSEKLTFDDSVNSFVWKAMNSWYNWQEDVPSLADSKAENEEEFLSYVDGYDTPQELFESLKHAEDDFSWFIDDYVVQQESFQGISTSFGITITNSSIVRVPNTNFIIIYIKHISTNSPADIAGFKRGDIINAFNGTVMTIDNYKTVLNAYSEDTTTFSFTENDGITFKEQKTITRTVISDNPIHLTKVFNDIAGKKVGYLVYNGFRSSFNDELNDAFATFKNEGIQEFILDLRINGGGSVLTSAFLASMIYNGAGQETTFAELRYNSKQSSENATEPFYDDLIVYDSSGNRTGTQTINRLSGISKIYVLASENTASASEMIINGLRPFIEVKIIGTTTTGKNEGSITLYDSPSSDYTNVNRANPAHKMAMQPIVFQVFNNLGQSDYTNGFEPDILIQEWDYWNNILPFGDENEIILKTALDDIRGISAKSKTFISTEKFNSKVLTNKFEKEMYIENY